MSTKVKAKTKISNFETSKSNSVPPPPAQLYLPTACPILFVNTGNWRGQRIHDNMRLMKYAVSPATWRVYTKMHVPVNPHLRDLTLPSSSAKDECPDDVIREFSTWQDVLMFAQSYCIDYHDHTSDQDGMESPLTPIYEQETYAAAAAQKLGLKVVKGDVTMKDSVVPSDSRKRVATKRASGVVKRKETLEEKEARMLMHSIEPVLKSMGHPDFSTASAESAVPTSATPSASTSHAISRAPSASTSRAARARSGAASERFFVHDNSDSVFMTMDAALDDALKSNGSSVRAITRGEASSFMSGRRG